MKIPKRTVDDLLTLIDHARADLSYGEGGTYNDGYDNIDTKEVKQTERAIAFIKKLIVEV